MGGLSGEDPITLPPARSSFDILVRQNPAVAHRVVLKGASSGVPPATGPEKGRMRHIFFHCAG
jgi:hypothetical protein